VGIEFAENQSDRKTSNNLSSLTLKQNQETRQTQAVDRVNDLCDTYIHGNRDRNKKFKV
jgi:hypothetical protein